MGRATLASLLVAAVLGTSAGQAGSSTAAPERVTFIGDSIASAITYDAPSKKVLANGIDLDLQLAVCRRLVGDSCPYQGVTAARRLVDLAPHDPGRADGRRRGRLQRLRGDRSPTRSRQSLQALRKAGAERVLWLTLRADRTSYLEHERRHPGRRDAPSRVDGGRLEPLLAQPSRLVPGRRPPPERRRGAR